jgi:hypothetical protein
LMLLMLFKIRQRDMLPHIVRKVAGKQFVNEV